VIIVETCVPDEVRGRRETQPAANNMRLHLFLVYAQGLEGSLREIDSSQR
jgi:hypothetical protein